MNTLIIGADNLITIDKLMVPQSKPPQYVNNATITWNLLDGTTSIGTGTYSYIGGSNGQYTTTIHQALTSLLTNNKKYKLQQNVVATGFTSLFEDEYTAVLPDSSQFTYAVRSDLENEFGSVNVERWADINNDGNAQTIDARINWALLLTYNEVNSKLFGGIYSIPLKGRYPIIIHVQALLACVRLYESRGMTNTDESGAPIHQLQTHKKDAMNTIAMIRAGIIRIHGTLPEDVVGTHVPLAIRSRRYRPYSVFNTFNFGPW